MTTQRVYYRLGATVTAQDTSLPSGNHRFNWKLCDYTTPTSVTASNNYSTNTSLPYGISRISKDAISPFNTDTYYLTRSYVEGGLSLPNTLLSQEIVKNGNSYLIRITFDKPTLPYPEFEVRNDEGDVIKLISENGYATSIIVPKSSGLYRFYQKIDGHIFPLANIYLDLFS